jgi:hypothetical protein
MAGGTARTPVGAIGQRVPHDWDVTSQAPLVERPCSTTSEGRLWVALSRSTEIGGGLAQMGGELSFPFCPAAVIYCLKPRHPTLGLFQCLVGRGSVAGFRQGPRPCGRGAVASSARRRGTGCDARTAQIGRDADAWLIYSRDKASQKEPHGAGLWHHQSGAVGPRRPAVTGPA